MTLTFFCNYLNHHQVLVADELYRILGQDYVFVATLPGNLGELKGGEDYSMRPYCLQATLSSESVAKAMHLAIESDVCVFGACSQKYAIARAKFNSNGISFEYGERWLKKGFINVLSPVLLRWLKNYILYYHKKSFYKLCSSAFAAQDDARLGCYRNRHYKWGYFTKINAYANIADQYYTIPTKIMWCSRMISWKHPELPVLMAHRLKQKGYGFVLDMYGEGEYKQATVELVKKLGLEDTVRFFGNMPNDELMLQMRRHSIFLFTSDRNEGWGAVANESMANGCVLVASDGIGSTPYLIENGVTGLSFRSPSTSSSFDNPDTEALDALCDKVERLLDNPDKIKEIRNNAMSAMTNIWSPENAAKSLLILIDDLSNGRESSIPDGPCSKA